MMFQLKIIERKVNQIDKMKLFIELLILRKLHDFSCKMKK